LIFQGTNALSPWYSVIHLPVTSFSVTNGQSVTVAVKFISGSSENLLIQLLDSYYNVIDQGPTISTHSISNASFMIYTIPITNSSVAIANIRFAYQAVDYGTTTVAFDNISVITPVTYNGLPQAAVVNSSVSGTVSNVQYNGSARVPTAVGTYSITADFAPIDSTDYNSLTGALVGSFAIQKATPTVTVTGATSFTYNATAQGPASVSVSPTDTGSVSYSYQNSGGPSYGPSSTPPTADGNYTVTATVAADANNNTSSSSATAFTIGALPVTLSGNRSYDGTATANASILTVGNNLDGSNLTLSGSAILAGANVGSPSIISFNGLTMGGSAAGNYTLAGASGTVTISQAGTFVGASSSENPSGYKDRVSYTATLPADATGIVVFSSTNGPISTNSVSSGTATSLAIINLPRGTNVISVAYCGDGNYVGSTNTLNQIITNHPPVAADATYYRAKGMSLKIAITNLLSNVTDLDGDTNNLQSVGAGLTNATIMTDSTCVYYLPGTGAGSNDNDVVSYTVSDGFGGTATANILVNVYSATGPAQMSLPTNGVVNITFFGIPNYTYVVQTTTNLSVPWWTLSTNTAGTNGIWLFTDPNATNAQQYYRSAQP